ncbi:MAG: translocation/assembly module TamB domain-containing protein [Bacteroidetes bacterium]|nr:translocation/assembly module TamB domain-containing protein [Bacteroidota bacterium]
MLILLVLVLYGLLHLPPVQTWLVKQVASSFSQKLHTRVTIKSVDFSFFDKLDVQGIMIEDKSKDTLLYAGAARVRITDWFFFKDHITLHYVGLNDAVVNMNRSDSVWNYQFLLDYFSSPSSGKKTSGGIEFDFKEADCKNIRFNRKDGWIGQNMIASMTALNVTFDSVDLTKQKIIINQVSVNGLHFGLEDYTGKKPPSNKTTPVAGTENDTLHPSTNDKGWTIAVKKMRVQNGSFSNEQETTREPYTDRFDGQHMLISAINGEIENVLLKDDTLTANISLAAKEKSGFEIKKINAAVKFTAEIMEFKDLDLVTNNSHLRNYYSMRYENFNEDMQNFLHNVRLEGRFIDSELSSDDLAYFAPELASWKRTLYFSGNAKGSIDNLTARDMRIKSGNTFVDGDISLRGLPDITGTFIDFKGNMLHTTYNDLVSFIPSLKNIRQPNLARLGNIYYKGNFTGFINDFVTYGTLRSDLGTATTDINMKLPENRPPAYSGRLNTENFRLGAFMGTDELGNISLSGAVKGSGFTLKDLNANFNGSIKQIEFNDYNFRNIELNGKFEKKQFNGHLTIDDPNLKINSLDGMLSLAGKKEIAFNLNADLAYAHLKNIRFTKDDFTLSGLFALNFTGNNIDNFLGTAKLYNASLTHDSTRLSLDSLTLSSFIRDEKKYLSLQSNEIDAELMGQFKILELPDAFKLFLNRYYPAYIPKPTYALSDQHFNFDIRTRQVDEYIRLLDKRLSGFNYSTVNGHLNLANSELIINADVPDFAYDGKTFTNTRLKGYGNGDTLKADVSMDDIGINDSLHFPGANLQLSANNDISEIHLKTSAGKTLNDAELNATVQTYADGVKIHFSPSSFIINDKKWLLENDGELTIRKNYLDANEIKFINDRQQISISTELDDVTDKTHIVAKLTNVNVGDFTPFAFKDPSVKGLLTGTAIVRDPFGKTAIEFKGRGDSLYLNDKYIGNSSLEASANTVTGLIKYKASSDDSSNLFVAEGTYDYLDSTGNALNLDFMGKRVNINILEPYMESIFSKMNGWAQTHLKIYSKNGKEYITGKATLLEDTITVNYTKCRYTLSNQEINFNEDEIDLGHLLIKDSLKNDGALTGKISHHFFSDLSFKNVNLQTGKLVLLNTTKLDNADFYGYVIGRANVDISGPTTNLVMDIEGQPSALDSSHIYLPTGSSSKEAGTVDYIEFVQFGSEMQDVKSVNSTNIVVNLNLKATPTCKIDVILDEETKDIIKGQGNGNINIRVGNKEPLTIRGKYELTKGEYTFNFQTFLKKPFTLDNGSITWNGDPYLANIDIEAQYLAKNVDISPLTTTGKLVQKEDIIIKANLTGNLKEPQVKFHFEIPGTREASKDLIVVKRLTDFENDQNEMNKQVASLLLFNTFIIGDQNFLSGGNTLAAVTTSIGGMISNWLTGVFNKQLEKATNGKLSTYIDIDPTLDLQKNASQLQASVRAGLRVLFSSRLVLLIGGNLDYNNSAYTQQLEKKGLVTPDISIEWLLNKEGTVRVVGFNRSSVDFTLNQRNRSGVQLTYRKDVNKVGDLFKSKKRLAAEEAKKQKR